MMCNTESDCHDSEMHCVGAMKLQNGNMIKGRCRPMVQSLTANDLAKVYLAASSDFPADNSENSENPHKDLVHGANRVETCAMGVSVALGECQHDLDPTGPVSNFIHS